jgi:hypothetical protein
MVKKLSGKGDKNKKSKRERARERVKRFNMELKKSLNTAIVAAFGFLMALVWRDVITEWVNEISASSPVKGKLITAIIVTLISVLGIMIVTKFLSEKNKDKK